MELTIITGMSGAGKSQAMGAFEDFGWFCVDSFESAQSGVKLSVTVPAM